MENRKKKLEFWLTILVPFLVYFILMMHCINSAWFQSDELDIFIIGRRIVRGERLYSDIYSQHMPVSYYISALFCRLGLDSVEGQRIAFYALFSGFWTYLYHAYKRYVNPVVLLLYPVIYIFLLPSIRAGMAVLSEMLAGIGIVMFWLEFLKYYREQKITWDSCIRISIVLLLTVGTVFVSAYAILPIPVAVLLLDIRRCRQGKDTLKKMVGRYFRIGVVAGLPWLILGVYYKLNGSLMWFYKLAYKDNRTIYSKYLNGGYGENPFTPVILSIQTFFAKIAEFLNNAQGSYQIYHRLLFLAVLIMTLCYVLRQIYSQKKYAGCVLLGLLLLSAPRGYYLHFHATNTLLLAFCSAGFLYDTCLSKKTEKGKIIGTMMLVFISLGFTTTLDHYYTVNPVKSELAPTVEILKKITEPEDQILDACMCNGTVMLSGHTPIHYEVSVPWGWESRKDYIMGKLEEDIPRVAIYTDEWEIWGYSMKDYAPEFVQFVKENYKLLDKDKRLYVRKDYYRTAKKKLKN